MLLYLLHCYILAGVYHHVYIANCGLLAYNSTTNVLSFTQKCNKQLQVSWYGMAYRDTQSKTCSHK